jgi:acyl carrier protein
VTGRLRGADDERISDSAIDCRREFNSMSSWLNDKLCSVLQKDLALDVENIGPDDRLIEDLGMDSVAFAIALVAIEDHTGLQLSGQQLMECRTVGEVDTLFRVALAGGPGLSADA